MNHTSQFQEQFLKHFENKIKDRKHRTDKILPQGYIDVSWLQKRLNEKIAFYSDLSPVYIINTLYDGSNDAINMYSKYVSNHTRGLIQEMLNSVVDDVNGTTEIRNAILTDLEQFWRKEIGRTLPDAVKSTYNMATKPTLWNFVKFLIPSSDGGQMRKIIMKELEFDSIMLDVELKVNGHLKGSVVPSFARDIGY